MTSYELKGNATNQRLDQFLVSELPEYSRTMIKQWIKSNWVTVNEKQEKSSYKVQSNDVIAVAIPEMDEADLTPIGEEMALDVIYEDDDLLVINKPKGLVVHPTDKQKTHTLVNGLVHYVENKGEHLAKAQESFRPGIVHRIDKDTTGLLVIAKSDLAMEKLSQQAQTHQMTRRYTALVYGEIPESSGTINVPIKRHPKDRLRYEGHEDGREALTHFFVFKRYREFTLLHLELETGRTHQIRVHTQFIGYPVVDDPLYARQYKGQFFTTNGQLLHAHELQLKHPRTEEMMIFKAELPSDFANVLTKLHAKRV